LQALQQANTQTHTHTMCDTRKRSTHQRNVELLLKRQRKEEEWAQKRAAEAEWSESSMRRGFVVRVSATGAHTMTQAEIEQKRNERMSRESAKRALKRSRRKSSWITNDMVQKRSGSEEVDTITPQWSRTGSTGGVASAQIA